MTQVAGDWLSERTTQALIATLEEAGHAAYFVGGCVRNALLGVKVADVDISTSAHPDQVTKLAEGAGFAAHPTGIAHGTVTVATGSTTLEVTTFRRDVETDGRRAIVAFAETVDEDARRRDFTMNALYARRDGSLVDPLGGLPDLQARYVRFIEDPEQRIREDYLRILRFFRFTAYFGDAKAGFDRDGLAACARLAEGLETLSKERVGAEVLKLLTAPDPAPAAAAMQTTGCLARVLPGATAEFLAPLVHLERDLPPNPIRRLSAMAPREASTLLRLSRGQARDHLSIRTALLTEMGPAELAYRIGAKLARDAILIRHASSSLPLPETLDRDLDRGARATFPVKSSDLPKLEGRALGARLKALEEAWIAADFTPTREALLK